MAVQTLPAFTMDAAVGAAATSGSALVALPGTPASDALVVVTNLGPCHVAVKLISGSSGSVAPNTGFVILAGKSEVLAIAAGNDHLAIISCGGPGTSAMLNIATGN
jgi:hypothetical protein